MGLTTIWPAWLALYDRLSAVADGAFVGASLPNSAYRQAHLRPHASQIAEGDLPSSKYGHGLGFEIRHWSSHLFQRLINTDRLLRNPEEHADSITTPLRYPPVTESLRSRPTKAGMR